MDKEKWVEEFDELYISKTKYLPKKSDIKSFISKQISKAHQAGRKEVLEEVKKTFGQYSIQDWVDRKLKNLEQKESKL